MPDLTSFQWNTLGTVAIYSAAVVLASILGGLLPEWIRLTHTRMQLMISFVGGVMLGIAIFHMIPHALAALGPAQIDQVAWGVMLGLLTTFFLLRFFHFHQHGPADFGILADERQAYLGDGFGDTHLCSEHTHPTTGQAQAVKLDSAQRAYADPVDKHSEASHSHGSAGCEAKHAGHTRWIAVLVGLGLHTLLDGVALGAGIAAESEHAHGVLWPGFGIFLAVLLHKPLDAVSITSLMHPVTSPGRRLAVNVSFALMCPLGAVLFLTGTSLNTGWAGDLAGWGLAFSAGVFLCISLSDLLPEMEFHSHSRIPLSTALLLGIAAAWAIGLAEGEHAHLHVESATSTQPDHDHEADAQGDAAGATHDHDHPH